MIFGYKNKKIIVYDKNFNEILHFGLIYLLIILLGGLIIVFSINISPVKTNSSDKEIQNQLIKSEKDLNLIIK